MNPNLLIIKKGHLRFLSDRKTTRESFKLWVNSTYILTLLFIWFLGIYYVWTLNVNATKWYNIRTLDIKRNALNVEKDLLDVKIAEMQSLSNLMQWEGVQMMEASKDADFIVVNDLKNYAFTN